MSNPIQEFGNLLNDLMQEAFEPEIVTLHNDQGEELEAEIVDYVEYNDEDYVILTEAGSNGENVLILKIDYDEKTGEEKYKNIADENLIHAVVNEYLSEEDDDDFLFFDEDEEDSDEESSGEYTYEFPFVGE